MTDREVRFMPGGVPKHLALHKLGDTVFAQFTGQWPGRAPESPTLAKCVGGLLIWTTDALPANAETMRWWQLSPLVQARIETEYRQLWQLPERAAA